MVVMLCGARRYNFIFFIMKVRFLMTVAGNDFMYTKGQEVDLESAEAVRYLNANYAEAMEEKETKKRTTRKK
jgi:hypothetical protein